MRRKVRIRMEWDDPEGTYYEVFFSEIWVLYLIIGVGCLMWVAGFTFFVLLALGVIK